MSKQLHVHTEPQYTIHIDSGLLSSEHLIKHCLALKATLVIISDENVTPLYGERLQQRLQAENLQVHLLTIPAGEVYKSRETKQRLEDEMLKRACGRDTAILALGGGVITDLAGFIAATYCRGIPVIYLPTTLLAMVDASVGGKTGVNTPYGKNLIGTFTQPKAVYMDTDTLNTLPEHEMHNGLAEIVKHALLSSEAAFLELQNKAPQINARDIDTLTLLIAESCKIKRDIVEQDETEQGIRQRLNLGHTIAHALEAASEYQISHGHAVAIGLVSEAYLASQLGLLAPKVMRQIQSLLQQLNMDLPFKHPNFTLDKIKHYLTLDKKAQQKQPYFVLLSAIGEPYTKAGAPSVAVDDKILNHVIQWTLQEIIQEK